MGTRGPTEGLEKKIRQLLIRLGRREEWWAPLQNNFAGGVETAVDLRGQWRASEPIRRGGGAENPFYGKKRWCQWLQWRKRGWR